MALQRLRKRLIDDTSRATRKVLKQIATGAVEPAAALRLLCELEAEVKPDGSSVRNASLAFEMIARAALVRVGEEDREGLLDELLATYGGLHLMTNVLARLMRDKEQEKVAPEEVWLGLDQAKSQVSDGVEKFLTDSVEDDGGLERDPAVLVWAWRFLDPDPCRKWLRGYAEQHGVTATLVALAPITYTDDGERSWVSPFSTESLNEFLGLDFIFARLDTEVDEARAISEWDNKEPDTPDARLRLVQSSIKRARGTAEAESTPAG